MPNTVLLSSLVVIATIVIAYFAIKILPGIQRLLIPSANREIQKVHADTRSAEKAIGNALLKGKNIRILVSRGNEFQRELYSPIFQIQADNKLVRLLLPDPKPRVDGVDWIDYREREAATFDKAFGKGIAREQVINNLRFLAPYITPGQFEVRKYIAPHMARIILTDSKLFLAPYKSSKHGKDSPIFEFTLGHFYEMFDRYFEMIWLDSEGRPL